MTDSESVMSDRVQELVLEAGFPCFGRMYVVSDGEELRRFAELVVEECLYCCRSHAGVDGVSGRIEASIREVFGLEDGVCEEGDHTPGPWVVYEFVDGYDIRAPEAECWVTTASDPEAVWGAVGREEDARLIAAAPELLEALEKVVSFVDAGEGTWTVEEQNIARAAIAKARGLATCNESLQVGAEKCSEARKVSAEKCPERADVPGNCSLEKGFE